MRSRLRAAVVLAVALGAAAAANAVQLVGTSFTDGTIYDIDPETGAAANPRTVVVYDDECPAPPGCVLQSSSGVEVLADGSLLLAPVESAVSLGSKLVREPTGPGIGSQSSVALDAQIGEGDLALDPMTGHLYAFGLTNLAIPFLLLRIEPGANEWADPTTTVVGEIGVNDVSALAFDAAGTLYAIDTTADALLTLDPSDASTLTSVALSEPLGALAGMDFDPDTGTPYVADGGTGGRDALFTLEVETGALTEIGPLGLEGGLSGLAVPEANGPAPAIAVLAALGALARRARETT
jgi:hypothetical protein